MSYPPPLAATLSGATVRQLAYWRKAPTLFEPEFGRRPRVLYSYRDIVALRMFVQLREQLSLQRVRRAVQWLEKHYPETHLSAHRLRAVGATTAVWISPDGEFIDLVDQPGHAGFEVVLQNLFGEFTTSNGHRVPDLGEPTPGVSIDPDVRAGYPVIEGTRIPFNVVASLRHDGMSDADIADLYPSVTSREVAGAIELADWVALTSQTPLAS